MKHLLLLIFSSFCLVQADIFKVQDALNTEAAFAFPCNVSDSSCMSTSCPGLSSASLCGPGMSVDEKRTLQALSECMKGNICGVQIDRRPVPVITYSLNELLPPNSPINIICTTTSAILYSNTVPNISPGSRDGDFQLNVPNLNFGGDHLCNISSSSSDSSGTIVTLPALYNYTYTSLLSVSSVNSTYQVSISQSSYVLVGAKFGEVALPGSSDFMPMFRDKVKGALGNYSLNTFMDMFYSNLISSAFQVAETFCESVSPTPSST